MEYGSGLLLMHSVTPQGRACKLEHVDRHAQSSFSYGKFLSQQYDVTMTNGMHVRLETCSMHWLDNCTLECATAGAHEAKFKLVMTFSLPFCEMAAARSEMIQLSQIC